MISKTKQSSSLLLAFLGSFTGFTASFATALLPFLAFTLSKLGLKVAVHCLRLATQQIFSLHVNHFVDPLFDHLHVPEDSEVVLPS